MKINTLGYVMILLMVIIMIKMYYDSEAYQLKCIISDIDGNTYCVRERHKLELAANLLAETTVKMKKLVHHMKKEYPNRNNVNRLVKNFRPHKIVETLPTSQYTAYSENKGEKNSILLEYNKRW